MIDVIRGGEPLGEHLVESLDRIRSDETIARIPETSSRRISDRSSARAEVDHGVIDLLWLPGVLDQ